MVWLRALRKQRQELNAEMERTKTEYEAKLLIEKKRSEWLSDKLIATQRNVRLLTYEIERKEDEISALRKHIRGEEKLGRGFTQKTGYDEDIAANVGV